jgi:S1-C subfamily serine protease
MNALPLLVLLSVANANPEDAVVRIQAYRAAADWVNPWRQLPVSSALGSGFVIDGNLIMTNAHVVRDARQLLIKRNNVADPAVATVVFQGDDCDLAVLKVEDAAFLKGIKPLKVGGLPKARSRVTTYGFPMGGEQVSSTSGIVSRVEWTGYSHSGVDAHLAIQTDAAINPGNSGGPVWQDGKVVGVAFQGFTGLDNVGFFIPTPVVEHFLTDIADKRYDGFPDGGLKTGAMISPALKRERRLPAGASGVIVADVVRDGAMNGVLLPGDVILSVEGVKLDDEGNIPLGEGRVPWSHLLDMKQVNAPLKMNVWRDGKALDVTAVARRAERADILRNQYNIQPRFIMHGGLLFMPLSVEYLKTLGQEWRSTAPRELLWDLFQREWEEPETAGQEVVVLARVLKHPVNSQLSVQGAQVVTRVNGKPIHSLKDLAAALDESQAAQDVFEFGDDAEIEALDRAKVQAVQKSIMKTYGVSRDRQL